MRNVDGVRYDRALVAICAGIDVGEVVVTAGVQALHPGQKMGLLGPAPCGDSISRLGRSSIAR